MDEGFDLDALGRALRHLFKGQFPGQHGAVEAVLRQKRHALAVVHGHLGAGVQLELRGPLANSADDAEVLYDHGVRAAAVYGVDSPVQGVQLVRCHQRVQRHMDLHAPGMTIRDGPVQGVAIEIRGIATGVERARSQVHRVRAVLHRGDQRVFIPRRGQQLHTGFS